MLVIQWISEIWSELETDLVVDSFQRCGITSSDSQNFHHQLRHFFLNNELINDMIDDDDDNDELNGFNSYYDSETELDIENECEEDGASETDEDDE